MLWKTLIIALFAWSTQAFLFDPIYAVHTNNYPECPPGFWADDNFIACCTVGDSLTSGYGVGHSLNPACCFTGITCVGAAPPIYDWSFTVDALAGSTSIVDLSTVAAVAGAEPTSVAPQQAVTTTIPTATSNAEATTTAATSTRGSNSGNSNSNGNTNNIDIKNGNANRISGEPNTVYYVVISLFVNVLWGL